ncbi:MAG: efflux RND transporter periplasmic adaptor subunit [Chloroflexales bacterium]|nr:efflux RND transporter periplasmic adaptor subunit [Chloroflexales bacterium]
MASAATQKSRKRSRIGRTPLIIISIIVVIILIGGITFALGNAASPAAGLPTGWQTTPAERGTIDSTVSATGNVEPLAEANLSFEVNGIVTEIVVKPGETVEPGQVLARIDDTDLQLRAEQAAADLKQAQADYADLLDGATEQELAEAQERLSQARAQLQQTVSSVSPADIDAARAELEQAQARLARLESGPETDEVASANESVQRAQTNLAEARTQLASAKENAKRDMESAANTLRDRQDEYSQIYWDNRELEKQFASFGQELPQENKNREAAALRAVEDAERALDQRRTAYEDAQNNEITSLQAREAELESAFAARDKLLAGTRAEDLASARAQVQNAQARLNQLTGANRSSSIAAQQSNVELAEIALEQLQSDPNASALAKREAAVIRAEAELKQAQRNAEQAALKAPFSGTIARIDMRVGESAGSSSIIVLTDLSSLHVDVPVDELDVALIETGQPVRITLDALPDAEISGTVTNVAPIATRSDQGTTSYEVTIELDADTAGVLPGMTAVAQIITQQKNDALLVPRRAVRAEGGTSYVLIPTDGTADPRTGEPASERREVTVGLSNNEFIEITSGLEPGEQVLVEDVVSTFNPLNN